MTLRFERQVDRLELLRRRRRILAVTVGRHVWFVPLTPYGRLR